MLDGWIVVQIHQGRIRVFDLLNFLWPDRHLQLRDLEQEMTEQKAGERLVSVARLVAAESARGEAAQERIDPAEAAKRRTYPGRGRRAGADQREHLRVGQGDFPQAVREPTEVVLPVVAPRLEMNLRVTVELVENLLHNRVEQLLTTVDVPVQRHRLDTESVREVAHGQLG